MLIILFLFVTHVCILLFLLSWILYVCILFTTLWANSADDKLMIFFVIFQENRHRLIFHADYLLRRWSSYFLGKTRKNMSLTSAEFAHCMVNVNQVFLFVTHVCIFSLELYFICLYFVYHFMCKFSRWCFFVVFFLFFSKKWALTFYADCLLWRSFASNDNTCFLGKHKSISKSAEFFSQGAEC